MLPDKKGHFGEFGGRFVPEMLIFALDELEYEYIGDVPDETFEIMRRHKKAGT